MNATPNLLFQPSSERSRGKVPKDGKINFGLGNHSSEAPPIFPSSYYRSSNGIPDEASVTQTRDLRKIDEVGHRAKRVRHPVQAKNHNKRVDLSRIRHGIHLAEPAENAHTETNPSIWKLFVDGASNAQGSGAGLILTSPEGIDIEYALRFGF